MAGRGRNSDVVTIIYPPGCREVNILKSVRILFAVISVHAE